MEFAAEPWDYLAACEVIDIEHPLVQATAARLRNGDDVAFAEEAFAYVRDEIAHSGDTGDRRVTWRASDVLREGTGLCYAKSHAYVALLRAAGVQAGLSYQRLRAGDGFVLHGLTAILVDDRWVRLDPRGGGVEFSASEDRLAHVPDPALGESDYLTVYASPPPAVIDVLRAADDCAAMCEAGALPSAEL
ncbi:MULTISPECIES: transglutaminase-like domain-containing protein [Thermomonosporaceae]|uniref:transglutaminase-like domain-containing protein n=1 Tax=Thermomonosporaceae TaxID=2012 RepID=UPI00255B3353|nr:MULTISPECIES: transglutaminase family protein [Thermomonosporaceae]MDL4771482.1 transglutaminase family protein [Actinomadura xylanilytica]